MVNIENEKSNVINPYLDGRKEWLERYGSYIAQAKNWRIFALMSAFVSVMAVGGVVYIGSQSQVQPYIVEVDKLGDALAVAPAQPVTSYDVKVIKYMLGDFIVNLRTVYKDDPAIQKKMIFKSYDYLSSSLPAYNQVSEFFKNNSPFEMSFDTAVEISSVLVLAEKTFQIDWIEKQTDTNGKELVRETYRATVNIEVAPPKNADDVMKNPLGLYVKDISFQKTLN